jgi:hypothetical protein
MTNVLGIEQILCSMMFGGQKDYFGILNNLFKRQKFIP